MWYHYLRRWENKTYHGSRLWCWNNTLLLDILKALLQWSGRPWQDDLVRSICRPFCWVLHRVHRLSCIFGNWLRTISWHSVLYVYYIYIYINNTYIYIYVNVCVCTGDLLRIWCWRNMEEWWRMYIVYSNVFKNHLKISQELALLHFPCHCSPFYGLWSLSFDGFDVRTRFYYRCLHCSLELARRISELRLFTLQLTLLFLAFLGSLHPQSKRFWSCKCIRSCSLWLRELDGRP